MSSKNRKSIKLLLMVVSVLIVAFIALTVVVLNENGTANNVENNIILKGVTIGGVDVSGMDKEEAFDALSKQSSKLLDKIKLKISVNKDVSEYSAKQLGLGIDYEATVSKALSYGYTGTREERKIAEENAKSKGVDITLRLKADDEKLLAALNAIKEKLDRKPQDAGFEFMPRGFSGEGKKYTPDEQALIKACASGKAIALPDDLVKISQNQMPNKLRYEYYREKKFINDYIPLQANISRFYYKKEVTGISVDTDDLADKILAVIESGNYSKTVEASVKTTEPKQKLADIKKQTALISSWTSSYAGHNGYNRNWNLSKLSGIINGVIIQPGEEWSINKLAGNRTKKNGWLDAAGIENGGYVDQPGGGVCQISSTLYNAAIRSDLEITDSTHHSIISGYIPIGLDATISSGAPDLKIKNNQSTPVYIVSYTNPKDKNVTVEIYGQTVVDKQFGDVILDFTSKDLGSYGSKPTMNYVYNATVSYDGTPIKPGKSVVYAETRPGRKVQTYKHILSLDGKELKVDKFTYYQWRPINGTTYVNGPDPATLPPEPTPTESASPSPSPTPSPSDAASSSKTNAKIKKIIDELKESLQ